MSRNLHIFSFTFICCCQVLVFVLLCYFYVKMKENLRRIFSITSLVLVLCECMYVFIVKRTPNLFPFSNFNIFQLWLIKYIDLDDSELRTSIQILIIFALYINKIRETNSWHGKVGKLWRGNSIVNYVSFFKHSVLILISETWVWAQYYWLS